MKKSILSLLTSAAISTMLPMSSHASENRSPWLPDEVVESAYGVTYNQRDFNLITLSEAENAALNGKFATARRKLDRIESALKDIVPERIETLRSYLNAFKNNDINSNSHEVAENSNSIPYIQQRAIDLTTLGKIEEDLANGDLEAAREKFYGIKSNIHALDPEKIEFLTAILSPIQNDDIISNYTTPGKLIEENIGNDIQLILDALRQKTGKSLVVFDNDEVLVAYGPAGRYAGKILINTNTRDIISKIKELGAQVICASSATQESVDEKLHAVGIYDLFDAVYGAEYRPNGDDFYAKHNIIQRHINGMGYKPDNLLFVDDTDVHRNNVANHFSQSFLTHIFEFSNPVATHYASIEVLQNLLGYGFEQAKGTVFNLVNNGEDLNAYIETVLLSFYS